MYSSLKGCLMIISIATVLIGSWSNSSGQINNTSDLTIRQIMQGEDFVGYLPTDIRWSEDSRSVYFSWNPEKDTLRATYRADIPDLEISRPSPAEEKHQDQEGVYSKDFTLKVYERYGDIFLMDLVTMKVRQITATVTREARPRFSGDGTSVIFELNNNLFSWNIKEGSTIQLTDFRKGSEPKEAEDQSWLEMDQLSMFEVLEKNRELEEASKYRRELLEPDRPSPVYTGNKRVYGLTISPDLNHVFYLLSGEVENERTKVPAFVTRSGYTELLNARPKVGEKIARTEAWILDLNRDTCYQVIPDDLEGIYDKPEFMREYTTGQSTYSDKFDKPRTLSIQPPRFSADGKAVLNVAAMDWKDLWIASLDLETGRLKQIDRQHDDAWIAGPGITWYSNGNFGWIDNEELWFRSERSGFSHLYLANTITGRISALTRGKFEVIDSRLSRDRKRFFLTTNEVSPHEHHFYHLDISSGKMERITSMKGGYEVTVSPDEAWLAVRYSYSNRPWELFVMGNEPGSEMKQVTHSTTVEFNSYAWMDPQIVRFKASDGTMVPATLYEPAAGKKNGAAVIFVHGAGYLQNVHHWWPKYYREYMFHNILADNGYTVLAIDYRGSAGYGREWRTAIYRHMGGRDLDDHVDGAAYLVREHDMDPDRIGIYGGSYGGFITLMAMFKHPDVFGTGAALRSVTDWAHYNHWYTSNILNTPEDDSLAYARSSPIYFAEGLEGHLLILHGVVDTNVQFQDVVRLSQRLIELEKENWELALFPVEGHGFTEPASWTDEYTRIFKLFQAHLIQK